jgi:hypothetical protein
VFYGSNLYRKDNPRWVIGNATETREAPAAGPRLLAVAACAWDHSGVTMAGGLAISVSDLIRSACAICAAWLISLPRRAGARLYAMNDAEARWWHWHVIERYGGLARQYCDARFAALAHDPTLRRDELCEDSAGLDAAAAPRPDCPCDGDL